MGRKKTIVGTTVLRVIEDAMLPDANKTGLLKALVEDSDITENVLEELTNSVGLRAERMFSYGGRTYAHGLPSGTFLAGSRGRPEVEAVLAGIEGGSVLLDYYHLGPPNDLHLGWLTLIQSHGYDPKTNKLGVLTSQKAKDVFLHDMAVVIPPAELMKFEDGVLELWGNGPKGGVSPSRPGLSGFLGSMVGHTPVTTDASAIDDYVLVQYAWEEMELVDEGDQRYDRKVVKFGEFKIPITDAIANSTEDFFHVKYSINGITKYWMYRLGAGTYPTLDKLTTEPPKVNGTFFPFAYFRYDKKSEIADTTTATYKTSKKLVKYLGMDYDAIAEAIDENPDIKDIQQAMLIMAVPANSKNPLERRYLFDFFDNLFYKQDRQYATPVVSSTNWLLNGQGDRSAIVIQDKRFKMQLRDGGVFKRRTVGSIGKIGTHDSGVSTEPRTIETINSVTDEIIKHTINVQYHFYRKQISETLYDEILITGLQVQYFVYGEYATTGDETDDILLIPLDHSITENYSIKDRELLYARSMHYVFNSLQIIKLKWYQTGIFKAIMMIITVVITVWTWGAASPMMAAFTAATGIAITGFLAVLLFKIVAGLVVGMVFKLFVKIVGIDLAFLVAIMAAAYGLYSAIETGSFTGAPFASELMQLSNGLVGGISGHVQDLMKDLMGEYEAFNTYKDAVTKELETANKLLDQHSYLSPFTVFGESPEDFYNRTVHAGNIGTASIRAISSYVDIALTLPKLNDTLGEIFT